MDWRAAACPRAPVPLSDEAVADANNKRRARLNIITHLLHQIPYESPPREPVVLPAREKRGGYREPDHSHQYIPATY